MSASATIVVQSTDKFYRYVYVSFFLECLILFNEYFILDNINGINGNVDKEDAHDDTSITDDELWETAKEIDKYKVIFAFKIRSNLTSNNALRFE